MPICRRSILFASASAAALFGGSTSSKRGFWDRSEPAAWTDADKLTLLSESPWAQVGLAQFDPAKKRAKNVGYGNDGRIGGSSSMPSGKPGATPGGDRSVPIGEEIPPVPNPHPGDPVEYPVLARWETAAPVRLAQANKSLPIEDALDRVYVLSLRGLPFMPPPKPPKRGEEAMPDPNAPMLHALRNNSRLERRGKAPIACSRLFAGSGSTGSREVLLVFPRDPDPILIADRLVTLTSFFDPYTLNVKFQLKDMLYKGALTL